MTRASGATSPNPAPTSAVISASINSRVTSTTASRDGGTRDAGRPGEAGATDAGPPCSDYSPSKNVYWGDLHSHTVLSADAYGWGARAFPHDAYLFASDPSYAVTIASGSKTPGPSVTIGRPLDFLAVTDHSEWLAATWGCGQTPGGQPIDPKSPYTGLPACATFRDTTSSGSASIIIAAENAVAAECDGGGELCPGCTSFTSSAWQVEIQAAHDAYQPSPGHQQFIAENKTNWKRVRVFDSVEAGWSVVQPIFDLWKNDRNPPLEFYQAGSDGPEGADQMLWRSGRAWRPTT